MSTSLRARVIGGETVIGGFVALGDPLGAELMARAGFDWALVDLQHGMATIETLPRILEGLQLGGASAIVRVAGNDPSTIMRVLDLGAVGVVVPLVNTASDARIASASTRYPPDGIRSYGPIRQSLGSTKDDHPQPLCLVMIETVEGVANVNDIASTPGVDGIFFGPVDFGLSAGLGFDGTLERPQVLDALDKVIGACRRHHRVVGTVALDIEHAARLLARGVQLLTLRSDRAHIREGAARDAAASRSLIDG